jgi:hypothetical protein
LIHGGFPRPFRIGRSIPQQIESHLNGADTNAMNPIVPVDAPRFDRSQVLKFRKIDQAIRQNGQFGTEAQHSPKIDRVL